MADKREEHRWRIERQRQAFRLGVVIYGTITGMYFVVAPITGALGYHLELPDGRLTLTVLAVLATPVFGVSLRQLAYVVATVLARVPPPGVDDDTKEG